MSASHQQVLAALKSSSALTTTRVAVPTPSTANLTTHTHSTVALGAAVAGRLISVGAIGNVSGGASIVSMLINGVSATQRAAAASGNRCAEIWEAVVPSDATGDIEIEYNGVSTSSAIVVWRTVDYNSATPTNTYIDTVLSGNILSVSADISAGGSAIAMAVGDGTDTVTWAGLTSDEVDAVSEAALTYHGIHDNFAAAQSGLTISAEWSGAQSNPALAVVAHR